MGKRILSIFSVIMVLTMILTASAYAPQAKTKTVADMNMFGASKFDAHYRVPNEGAIQYMLQEEQVQPTAGISSAQNVQEFIKEFIKRNWDTPNPHMLKELLDWDSIRGAKNPPVTNRSIKSLVTLVEFPSAPETWTSHVDAAGNCTDTQVTMSGPMHGEMAAPGPRDNNTIWYDDPTPEMYQEIYFGEGPNAGVTIHHPNVGDVHMGTMVNYYLEVSGGKFAPAGEVYPTWFTANHVEGYYGEDGCGGGSHNIRAGALVMEVLQKLMAQDPNFNWQAYDGNSDGVVDNFTVIHAGAGQEAGGGAEGNFAIWSHASMVGWPDGVKVCSAGSAGCPDRDIVVSEYSMDPENIDLGVISEEFGHAAFGLPDLYTTDAQGSISNWAIMEAGSWNGPLGGVEPAPFPLWFKYELGWAKPREIKFNGPATISKVGQLEKTPVGAYSGLKINLPDKTVTVDNPLGTGKAWWSSVANAVNYSLDRTLNLAGTTAPIFSFASYWSIEDGWDYGYVEVSTDGGATWTMLPDMDGIFTTDDPNGNNAGGVGLTGEGQGTLRFDLSAYAGQEIMIRLRYQTDTAVQMKGWFADTFSLTDGATVVWSDDVEGDLSSWTADGWTTVPLTKLYPRYYLVEWRSNAGFDHGLMYPYQTVYSDEDEWEVDRAPYTVPGMLVYMRDTSYEFDYTLYDDSFYEPPSAGPKHALLLVDSHFWPLEWDLKSPAGVGYRPSDRVQPANATFTAMQTTGFTLRRGYDPVTGAYLDTPAETKTFPSQEAVPQFHDSMGYYPGLLYGANGGLYWWNKAASMVIPAQIPYSVRITDVNKQPYLPYYGVQLAGFPSPMGSGNPGENLGQYGLHIAVGNWAYDGSWGIITTWNSPALIQATVKVDKQTAKAGSYLLYTIKLKNLTPAMQTAELNASIPDGTTFKAGMNYDKATNSIHNDSVMLGPKVTMTYYYWVKIDPNLPKGTVITNFITVKDDAMGDTAQIQTTVK